MIMLQTVTFFSFILALTAPTTMLSVPAPLPKPTPAILRPSKRPTVAQRRAPFARKKSPQQKTPVESPESKLLAACVSGDEDLTNDLLGQLVNPNCTDENGDTPLMRAIICNHPFIVQLLLVADADPMQRNKKHFSALDLAIQEGRLDVVAALIADKNIQLNKLNYHGFPVLAIAAQYGHDAVIELLIRKGALVNMPNKHGQTAIVLAIANGHVSTVALLLIHGATLPSFQISVKENAQEMAKLLSLDA